MHAVPLEIGECQSLKFSMLSVKVNFDQLCTVYSNYRCKANCMINMYLLQKQAALASVGELWRLEMQHQLHSLFDALIVSFPHRPMHQQFQDLGQSRKELCSKSHTIREIETVRKPTITGIGSLPDRLAYIKTYLCSCKTSSTSYPTELLRARRHSINYLKNGAQCKRTNCIIAPK